MVFRTTAPLVTSWRTPHSAVLIKDKSGAANGEAVVADDPVTAEDPNKVQGATTTLATF